MKKNNRETGAKAEAIACWFLKQQGYDVKTFIQKSERLIL